MHAEDSIREGMARLFSAIVEEDGATEEGAEDAVELIMQVIDQSDLGRELRTLRYQKKMLGKELGKSSRRIYDLRCQLTESRSFCTVDRSSYRSMRDQLTAALQRVKDQNTEIRELQLEVHDLHLKLLDQDSELSTERLR